MATCDVWELARRGALIEGELALGDAHRLAQQLVDVQGALRYRLTGLTDGLGRPAAALELVGTVRVRCDRCGGPVALPIRETACFHFVAREDELAALPIDDSPDEPLLGSHQFDVSALVEDQAILALPISPRHERCAAAAELTGEGAIAPGAETHRPFGVLAALKKTKP